MYNSVREWYAESSIYSATGIENVAPFCGSAVIRDTPATTTMSSSQLRKKNPSPHPGRRTGKTRELPELEWPQEIIMRALRESQLQHSAFCNYKRRFPHRTVQYMIERIAVIEI